jgi:hypothetical protein
MSAAVDIYVPTQWETTVSNVLTAAGFDVTARDRKLADGRSGREYSCTRDSAAITLSEMPIPEDSRYLYLLGLSRPKHLAALVSARDALTQHGALDSDTYNQRNRSA